MAKLTQKALMPNPAALADLVHLVDVSDTSQSPSGSSYRFSLAQLVDFLKKAGIGNWQLAAPTVNDDVTQGYINGAFWFDEDAQRFYILNDNSVGAADWRPFNLQFAYDGGNVVNGMTVTIDAATLTSVVAIGEDSALGNTGQNVFAIGLESAKDNTGNDIVGIGTSALSSNTGNGVNALGNNAGINNTANDSNFFGGNAGNGNATSHGVTVFSPESIPEYPDPATAIAALTVANGCVAGQIYLYRQAGVSNVIGYVIPT